MNRYIAYFDYLGFKEFIENNDLDTQSRIMANNFRDMECALGQGRYTDVQNGVIADISNSRINCINFSDTVVFFTNDTTEVSLIEILDVAYKFNWQAIGYCFPIRGALVYGEIESVDYKRKNSAGGVYNINSIFGKGLVTAHLRAEEQDWAGTVLDESFTDAIMQKSDDVEKYLLPYAKKYKVPYKDGVERSAEYVLNVVKGTLNDEALKNYRNGIINNFSQYNKPVDDERVKKKLSNTILFLESYYARES